MKKLVLLCLVAVSIFGFSCKKPTSVLEKIEQNGKMVMGCSADYPPFEFHYLGENGDEVVGFEVELGKAIAEDLSKKFGKPIAFELSDMDFDGILGALVSGKIDIAISGFTVTEERKQNIDFSDTYYVSNQKAIVRLADLEKFGHDIKSLKDSQVAAQKGTVQVATAKSQIFDVAEADINNDHPQVKEFQRCPDSIMALQSGKVDAIILEEPVALPYVKQNPDLALSYFSLPMEEADVAAAFAKGNEDFVAIVNETIARVTSDGTFDKWFNEASEKAVQTLE